MAFTDFDIIKYFQTIFIGIGIPENNVHIYNVDARSKDKQNIPSVLISRDNERIEIWNLPKVLVNKQRIIQNFKRIVNYKIIITTHIDENDSMDWHIGKIISLLFREEGFGRSQFDVGDNTNNISGCNGLRNAILQPMSINYEDISNTNRGLIVATIIVPVVFAEHSKKG